MKNKETPKPGWRMETKLRVLTVIYVLASIMSAISTGRGMLSTFFVGNAVLAYLASAVVQLTEISFTEKRGKAFYVAMLISVMLSAFQFVDAAYPLRAYSRIAEQQVNGAYTVFLPEVQTAAAEQMETVRNELFVELEAIQKAAKEEQDTATALNVEKAAVLEKYKEKASYYPDNYTADTMYGALETILEMTEKGDMESAARTVEETLKNIDDVINFTRLSAEKRLYRDICTDLKMIEIVLSNQTNTGNAIVEADVKELKTALMKKQVDVSALTATADSIVERGAELEVDLSVLTALRENASSYADLVQLCTTLKNHQANQPALAAKLEAANALPDPEESWAGAKALWQAELNTMRAELSASPLTDRSSYMTRLDRLGEWLTNETDLVGKFAMVACHPRTNGLQASLPAYIAIALALVLDLAAAMAVCEAKQLRRQLAKAAYPAEEPLTAVC